MGHRLLPRSGGSRGKEKHRRAAAGKAGAGLDLLPVGRDRTCADRAHGEGEILSCAAIPMAHPPHCVNPNLCTNLDMIRICLEIDADHLERWYKRLRFALQERFAPASIESNSHFTERINASRILFESDYGNDSLFNENSFSLGLRRDTSKKAGGTPIKTLINEEMSKEMEIRRPSPSLVARLMGLDTVPPQMVRKQRKKMGRNFQNPSSIGCQEKHVCCKDHLLHVSNIEDQEFKDVFEVMEASKFQRVDNYSIQKEKSSLMRSEIDLDYISQKFMDAKRLSTDEALRNSKELDEALEVLDSNKDLFLRFLQEPNSLFTKHLQDLNCTPPSPHVSHITILKSSRDIKYETSKGYFVSERHAERSMLGQNEVKSYSKKYATGPARHTIKECNCPQAQQLAESPYDGKSEGFPHSTKIVVLKPSLVKARKIESTTSLPISPENHLVGYRRNREYSISGNQQLHVLRRDRHKLSDNAKEMLQRTKSSREIAKEITKELRRTVRSSTEKVLSSGIDGYIREKVSYIKSGMDSLNNSGAFERNANFFDNWNHCSSSLSPHSTESSVSREARKRLSERWKMTNHFQEVIPVCRGSSTLGEMLALSDRELPDRTLESFVEKFSDEQMVTDEANASWGCPTGISSRDGWKEGCSTNLTRSKSVPASSSVYGNSKPSGVHQVGSKESCSMLRDVLNHGHSDSIEDNPKPKARSPCRRVKYQTHRLPHPCNSDGEENMLPEREIHVNQEKVRSSSHLIHFTEPKTLVSELSEKGAAGNHHLIGNCFVHDVNGAKRSSIAEEEHEEQPAPLEAHGKDEIYSGHDHNGIMIEDTSSGHSAEDRHECDAAVSSKETEQPSPVSVLEPPSEEEKSSSGCFEKISADLKELRMQLRLLKMESAATYAEDLEDNDEDAGGECHSPLRTGEVLEIFGDQKSRDFSYLLDMLSVAGVRDAGWARLSDACHSMEHPVDPIVFYRLEKKYSTVVSWLKSERRMFFDYINSILSEKLASCIDMHPWSKSRRMVQPISSCEDLVDDLWRMVVRQRKELNGELEKIMEPRWPDQSNYVDIIARDMEGMLEEDLLEELVSEFILG